MIKTIIIEDDIEMLQGLANIVCWEDYGFTISGLAVNGLDGLKLVSEIMPDVIITDITMPLVNGLDVIREAKKYKPDLKSVIISCHENFQYAKEALRLEADEYLLKHTLTKDELINVINKLKIKIVDERSRRLSLTETMRKLNTNKYVILEKFFADILENSAAYKEEIYSQAELMNITLPTGNFRLISLFADDLEENLKRLPIQEYHLFKFCVLNIMEETVGQEKTGNNFFPYQKNTFAFLYWDNTKEAPVSSALMGIVREIQKNVQIFLKFKLSACISGICPDISQLKTAMRETEALRAAYFYKGAGHIVSSGQTLNAPSLHLYKKFAPGFKIALSLQNHMQIKAYVHTLFETLSTEQYEPNSVRTLLRRLLADAEALLVKQQAGLEVFQIGGDTFFYCKKAFEDVMEQMLQTLNQTGRRSSRPEIQKVIEYIDSHIGEKINCDSMAHYVNMNSNYFSRLFKSEVGMSFSDYIMDKRMNVATELLRNSDYSIEDITKAVGIESVSYFYRAYKKITGSTPGDVRACSYPT